MTTRKSDKELPKFIFVPGVETYDLYDGSAYEVFFGNTIEEAVNADWGDSSDGIVLGVGKLAATVEVPDNPNITIKKVSSAKKKTTKKSAKK